ncbi:MAG TPA: hypothetical protein PKD96_04160 [Candidatus Absconditabacterales bacterium]|nr:hypothetical protein [Candidatus Absconditabacterales bacterium]HMT27475.1 hypothetical protein [Candidatus Absconditabacterales bacterium]
MKKIFMNVVVFVALMLGFSYAQPCPTSVVLGQVDKFTNCPYNVQDNILQADDLDNPLRQGTTAVGQGIDNLVFDQPITDSQIAQSQTLSFVRNIVNYFLGMVSFIALLYLIYHGYLMTTAAGDSGQFKKGQQGVQYAAIAIAGMALSWFVVSMIFAVLNWIILP